MTQFSYSFCMAMLHSFWQAALMLLLYTTVDKLLHKNNAPLAKRNFLYSSLAVQLVLFLLTFSIYFFDYLGQGDFTGILQQLTTTFGADGLQVITPWIFGLYSFIILYRFIKAVYKWNHFKQQYKTGLIRPSVELKLFTDLKAHHFGIKRKVKLWISHVIDTPVTFGYFKPIILIPVSLLNNISTAQAETLILHELAHIRTNDYLLNWFLIIAETLFFFNPFINGLCKQIRLEREKNCDLQVMSFNYSPTLYAETLLQAERIKQLVPHFQLAAVNTKRQLLHRIQFFTNEKILNQPLRFNMVAPLIGLLLLLLLSTAVLFQSGKAVFPVNAASAIKYIPFSNDIVSDADVERSMTTTANNFVEINATAPLLQNKQILERKVSSQIAIIPVPSVSEEPLTEADAEPIAAPVEAYFPAQPVTEKNNNAARQIIVKEEGSGTASLKVYYLSFENGQWILEPEWVISAKEISTGSIIGKIDSLKRSAKKVYPVQQ